MSILTRVALVAAMLAVAGIGGYYLYGSAGKVAPASEAKHDAHEHDNAVVLSDANTMIAGRDLSSVNDVEVVARVAYGGTAITASGDLIGRAVQKKGGGEDLDVVINQVQP